MVSEGWEHATSLATLTTHSPILGNPPILFPCAQLLRHWVKAFRTFLDHTAILACGRGQKVIFETADKKKEVQVINSCRFLYASQEGLDVLQ